MIRVLPGVVVLLAFSASLARADVTVEKKPVVIEHRTFDPAHPPTDMPPLKGNEAALTESKFDCKVGLNYRVIGHKRTAGGCESTLKVQGVRAILELQVIIWLPQDASAKLTAHEEGHRRIAERIYANADRIARELASPIDGKQVTGDGADCDAADKVASDSAADAFCKDYLNRSVTLAGKLGDAYDDLTAHGTRAEPNEDEAIREAFAKVASSDNGKPDMPRGGK